MPIAEALSYAFIQRALVAGLAVAASCGALGLFLVLRRYASIGDGLAHVGLGSVALGLVLGVTPLYVALPLTAAASLWILRLSEKEGLFGETAVSLVASVAAASAVMLASLGRGFSVDLVSYLFGSVLAVSKAEAWIAVLAAGAVLALVLAFRRAFFSLAYDPDYAKVAGLRTEALGRLLAVLAGITVAVGIRVVGSLLVSALVVFPAVTALRLGLGFRASLLSSVLVALLSTALGILGAVLLDLPAGASIVLVNFACFLAAGPVGALLRRRP